MAAPAGLTPVAAAPRGRLGETMFGGVTPVRLGEMIPGRPGATGRMGASGDREVPVGDG